MFIDTAPERVSNGRSGEEGTVRSAEGTNGERENCNNGKRVKENKNTSAAINRSLFKRRSRGAQIFSGYRLKGAQIEIGRAENAQLLEAQ